MEGTGRVVTASAGLVVGACELEWETPGFSVLGIQQFEVVGSKQVIERGYGKDGLRGKPLVGGSEWERWDGDLVLQVVGSSSSFLTSCASLQNKPFSPLMILITPRTHRSQDCEPNCYQSLQVRKTCDHCGDDDGRHQLLYEVMFHR